MSAESRLEGGEAMRGGPLEALAAYSEIIKSARERHQPGVLFEGKDAVAIASASGRCLNVGRND